MAFLSRVAAAERERNGTGTVCQFNSGDTDPAALFHKSLPHDELGQVNPPCIVYNEHLIPRGVSIQNDYYRMLCLIFSIDVEMASFTCTQLFCRLLPLAVSVLGVSSPYVCEP